MIRVLRRGHGIQGSQNKKWDSAKYPNDDFDVSSYYVVSSIICEESRDPDDECDREPRMRKFPNRVMDLSESRVMSMKSRMKKTPEAKGRGQKGIRGFLHRNKNSLCSDETSSRFSRMFGSEASSKILRGRSRTDALTRQRGFSPQRLRDSPSFKHANVAPKNRHPSPSRKRHSSPSRGRLASPERRRKSSPTRSRTPCRKKSRTSSPKRHRVSSPARGHKSSPRTGQRPAPDRGSPRRASPQTRQYCPSPPRARPHGQEKAQQEGDSDIVRSPRSMLYRSDAPVHILIPTIPQTTEKAHSGSKAQEIFGTSSGWTMNNFLQNFMESWQSPPDATTSASAQPPKTLVEKQEQGQLEINEAGQVAAVDDRNREPGQTIAREGWFSLWNHPTVTIKNAGESVGIESAKNNVKPERVTAGNAKCSVDNGGVVENGIDESETRVTIAEGSLAVEGTSPRRTPNGNPGFSNLLPKWMTLDIDCSSNGVDCAGAERVIGSTAFELMESCDPLADDDYSFLSTVRTYDTHSFTAPTLPHDGTHSLVSGYKPYD